MKTDQQLLEKIQELEQQLGPRRENNKGRCPIRLRINHLRWIIKTRIFRGTAVAKALSEAMTRRWQTHPKLIERKKEAERKKLESACRREKRRVELEIQKQETRLREAQSRRTRALLFYHQHANQINAARRAAYTQRGHPLDYWFRTATFPEKERQSLFGAINRLEAKLVKRRSKRCRAKILRILRRRLQAAFSAGRQFSKTARDILGCEIPYLRQHLESLWKPGMSWENYGYDGWHIDHIKPCAKFDLTDPEQQKACFHWTNLQPLWAAENFAKRAN